MAKQHANVLVFDFAINTFLTFVEIVVAIVGGSVAVRGDGFQNLTDSLVLTVAYIGEKAALQKSQAKRRASKIYHNMRVINSVILLSLATYMGYSSFYRLLHPRQLNGEAIILVGILSILINFWAAGLLYRYRRDKTTEAPYVGLLYSGSSGIGVLATGICTVSGQALWIDGAVGLIIATLLFARASRMLVRA